MSAPVAGKFQDHYVVLGIDPKSDFSAIEAAYAKLAKKYQPGNTETGDPEKFEAVGLAFEVLTDPNLRASFDKLKGGGKEEVAHQFSGAPFFEALKYAADIRAALLAILYDRRRTKPFTPTLSVRQLENMLQLTTEELTFALSYLKQRALVVGGDKGSVEITADGMDHVERDPPTPERVLRFIKPEAIADKPPDPGKTSDISGRGSVLRALNRHPKPKPPAENASAETTLAKRLP